MSAVIVGVHRCSRCPYVTASETRMHEHILARMCQGGAQYYTTGGKKK